MDHRTSARRSRNSPPGRGLAHAGSLRLAVSVSIAILIWSLPPGLSAAPGDLDAAFGSGGTLTTTFPGGLSSDTAFALALQPDGKILVAGRSFRSFAVARYHPDGALDTTFGNGGRVTTFNLFNTAANAVVVEPDGKILAGGVAGGQWALARYSASGALLTTLLTDAGALFGGVNAINALVLQPDGKVVLVGASTSSNDTDFTLVRYPLEDTGIGAPDAGFGEFGRVRTDFGGIADAARAAAIQPDDKIVAVGTFSNPLGLNAAIALARYNPDGSLDPGFGAAGKVVTALAGAAPTAAAVAIQPDGRLVVAGTATTAGPINSSVVLRYLPDGTLDTSFGDMGMAIGRDRLSTNEQAFGLALQPDGKILVGGNDGGALLLRRYNPDGSPDMGFGTDGRATAFSGFAVARAIALQPDGNVVAAGTGSFALARFQGGPSAPPSLAAAVLPSSRSVRIPAPATVFATILNAAPTPAQGCAPGPLQVPPSTSFSFQTTDPDTNALVGSPNTAADISPGGRQTYLVAFGPTAAVPPTEVQLKFDCANTDPAPVIRGVNTVLLSASPGPVPDVIALVATIGNTGTVVIPDDSVAAEAFGTGVFSVAAVNVGASGAITATADTGGTPLPVAILLCETNPATGQCISPVATTVDTAMSAGATAAFGVFVTGAGVVPFEPARHRVPVRFKGGDGVTRGSTSVAVRTQEPAP